MFPSLSNKFSERNKLPYSKNFFILDTKTGVPQVSRFGPLVFIFCMYDISSDIESDILIFADDTSLMATGFDPLMTAVQFTLNLKIIKKKFSQIFN